MYFYHYSSYIFQLFYYSRPGEYIAPSYQEKSNITHIITELTTWGHILEVWYFADSGDKVCKFFKPLRDMF